MPRRFDLIDDMAAECEDENGTWLYRKILGSRRKVRVRLKVLGVLQL
jgi:hypothetical protein